MKKIFLLAIVTLFAISLNVNAQVKFGVTAGANLSSIYGDDAKGVTSTKAGFIGGVFADISLLGVLNVQPELLFAMKGAKANDGTDKGTINSNYISVPVLVKYSFPIPASLVKPFLFIGPEFSMLMSAKVTTGGEDMDVKDSYNSTDVSYVVGAGATMSAGKNTVGVTVRYTAGLTKIIKDGDVKAYNKGIALMLSFGF